MDVEHNEQACLSAKVQQDIYIVSEEMEHKITQFIWNYDHTETLKNALQKHRQHMAIRIGSEFQQIDREDKLNRFHNQLLEFPQYPLELVISPNKENCVYCAYRVPTCK